LATGISISAARKSGRFAQYSIAMLALCTYAKGAIAKVVMDFRERRLG
jgi:hypothetical protein